MEEKALTSLLYFGTSRRATWFWDSPETFGTVGIFAITSSEEAFKVCEHTFFQEIKAESSVTCNLHVQSRFHLSQLSSCWLWHLTFSWVQFLSNKLEFFVSCNNIKLQRTFFFLLGVLICFFYKNLIVLHHVDNNSLSWHLYQIHTFNNNLKDEETITPWCVLYNFLMINMLQLLQLFYDKNIVFERK